MTTATAARDAIAGVVNAAWLASGITSAIALLWDNVKADPVGEDADGNALPFARVTVRTLSTTQETLGGVGCRVHQTEGQAVVQVFTPSGDGHALADTIVEVLKVAMRNVRVGDLWFFDVTAREVGQDGPYFNQNVQAGFRYAEAS